MDINSRNGFLYLAAFVEGGTVLGAVGLAAAVGIDPWDSCHWSVEGILIGLAGSLPLFAVYRFARGIRSVAVEMLGQPLSRCTWYDLLLLAVLAGLGEELLFRGVLQPWLSGTSPVIGLLGANLLFGVVHAVTPVYALLATGIGFFFSWLTYGLGEANLLPAMVAHGFYDFVAFLLIAQEYRQSQTREAPVSADVDPSN